MGLRSHIAGISKLLTASLCEQFAVARVEVDDARVTPLADAAKIAQVTRRHRPPEALLQARERAVEGALGTVCGALARMEGNRIGPLAP